MEHRHKATIAMLALFAAALVGCSAPRPALYPNIHYQQVGKATAEADIDDCMAMAKLAGHRADQSGDVAGSTAIGAGVGAASGAAVGAVFGNAGRGAAAGAAGGGVGGLARSMMKSNEPTPVYKNFVNLCLRERGYQPIGWE